MESHDSPGRCIRNQPFCWQEKVILREIRRRYRGAKRVKMISLYTVLTWIDSDFYGKDIDFFTETICTYSGLQKSGKHSVPKLLKEMEEELGIIKLSTKRDKNGRVITKILTFTPGQLKTINSKTIHSFPKVIEQRRIEDNEEEEATGFLFPKLTEGGLRNIFEQERVKFKRLCSEGRDRLVEDLMVEFCLLISDDLELNQKERLEKFINASMYCEEKIEELISPVQYLKTILLDQKSDVEKRVIVK